jgi:hypothetical protein
MSFWAHFLAAEPPRPDGDCRIVRFFGRGILRSPRLKLCLLHLLHHFSRFLDEFDEGHQLRRRRRRKYVLKFLWSEVVAKKALCIKMHAPAGNGPRAGKRTGFDAAVLESHLPSHSRAPDFYSAVGWRGRLFHGFSLCRKGILMTQCSMASMRLY